MRVLGIETSCDETGAAVVEDGVRILSNVVASQVEIHARYGGIVPEVASRQHVLSLVPTVRAALAQAGTTWRELDGVAVTVGPGLVGSLLVGANFAKAIALAHRVPLVGINHLEGHIYASWLGRRPPQEGDFPILCLIVSGGHSSLFLMEGLGRYRALGQTRDDAAGEAFDKVARILGLGFPGGPAIQREAANVDPSHHSLPRAWMPGSDDFSFSGLKTAVLRLVQGGALAQDDPQRGRARMAASFQAAVVDVLVTKTVAAAQRLGARAIVLGGGVAANLPLRRSMTERAQVPVLVAEPSLCTDNGAMIAACGYYHLREGRVDGWDLDVHPHLPLA